MSEQILNTIFRVGDKVTVHQGEGPKSQYLPAVIKELGPYEGKVQAICLLERDRASGCTGGIARWADFGLDEVRLVDVVEHTRREVELRIRLARQPAPAWEPGELNTIFRAGDEVEIYSWIGNGEFEWQPALIFEVCAGGDGVPLLRACNRGGRGDEDWGTYWADPERNGPKNTTRVRLINAEEQQRRERLLKAASAATNTEPELQAEPAPNEEETMPTAAVETDPVTSACGFYMVGDKVRVKPEGWAFGEVTAVGASGVSVAYRVRKVDQKGVFLPAQLKLKDGAEHERRLRLHVDEMVADPTPAAPKAPPRWSDIVKPVDEEEPRADTPAPPARRAMPFDPELHERAERALASSNGKHEPADEPEGQSIDENDVLKLTGFGHLLTTAEGMTVENLGNLIGALGSLLAAKCSAGKAELGARARRREKAAETCQAEQHFPLDEYLPDGAEQAAPAEPCSCRGQLAGPNALHGPDSCSNNGGTGLPAAATDETWDGESVDEHGAPVDSQGQQIGPEDLMAQGFLSADSSDLAEDLRPLTLGEVTEEMANELPAATQLYFTSPLGFAWRFVMSVIDGEKRHWVGYSQPASEGEEGSETKPTSWSKFTEHIGEAVFTLTINSHELRDKALEAFPEWAHANVILPWTAVRDGARIAAFKATEAVPAGLDDDWQPEGPLAARLAAKATEEAPEPDDEDIPMPALRVLQPGVTTIGDLTEDEINLLAADGLEQLNLVLRDPDGGIWWAYVNGSSQRPGGPVVPTNWTADFQPPPLPAGKVVKVKPDPRCQDERSWDSTAEFRAANAEQLFELTSDYWFNDHAVVIPDVLLPFVPVEAIDALALAKAEEEERERQAELERQQLAKLDGEPLPRGCCYGHVSVEQLDGLLEGRARLYASGQLGRDNTKWMIWAGESCYLAGKKTIKKEKLRRWLKCGGDEALTSAEFRAKFHGYTVRIEKADGVSTTPPRWATNCLVKHGAKVKRADLPFPDDVATAAKPAARR